MSKLGTMVVIAVDGTITETTIDVGDVLTKARAALLGDYLEIVPYFDKYKSKPCAAFCGEHGKLNGLRPNALATEMWRMQVPQIVDFIAGPMVIVYGPPAFMQAL